MLKQVSAGIAAATMVAGLAAPADAAPIRGVETFTDNVESLGNPHLQGGTSKSGRQLFVDGQPVQLDASASCNGQLEVFYKEGHDNRGNLVGTFWGVNGGVQNNGLSAGQAPSSMVTAPVEPAGGYIEYAATDSPIAASWQDVISADVDILRLTGDFANSCRTGGSSSQPQTNTPGDPDPEPELPGGGCQSGPCAIVDVNRVTYDEATKALLRPTYQPGFNIG